MSKLIGLTDGNDLYEGYVSENELRDFLSVLRVRNKNVSDFYANTLYIEYVFKRNGVTTPISINYPVPPDGIISRRVCYGIIRKLLKKLYNTHKKYRRQDLRPKFDDEIFGSSTFDLVDVLRMDYSWLYEYKQFPQPLVRIASHIPDNLTCPIDVTNISERMVLRRFLKTLRLNPTKKSQHHYTQHHELNSH